MDNCQLLKINGLEMLNKLEKFKAPFMVVLNNYNKLKKLCRTNKNVTIECFLHDCEKDLSYNNKIFSSEEFLHFFHKYAMKITLQ